MDNIAFSVDVEPDLRSYNYESITEGLPLLEKILNKYKIKPTLFITCDCLEKYPKIFKRLKNKGWEISLHGYRHQRFDDISFNKKNKNIKKSLTCFKKYLGIVPKGFRAPQHSLDEETINLLKRYKLCYDSSLNPWNFYHLFFFWKIKVNQKDNFTKSSIHIRNGLTEIPITSFFMPFSSVTLRIFPDFLLKFFYFFISFNKNPIFFIHSWDLIEINDSKIYRLCHLNKFLKKLDKMLFYFSKKRNFKTIEEIYHQFKLESNTLSQEKHMGVL